MKKQLSICKMNTALIITHKSRCGPQPASNFHFDFKYTAVKYRDCNKICPPKKKNPAHTRQSSQKCLCCPSSYCRGLLDNIFPR